MPFKPHTEHDHRHACLCYTDDSITEHLANAQHGGGGLPAGVYTTIDQFGRPQIWDSRNNAGTGAVYRQGGWPSDGDPISQEGEGIVIYGKNEDGELGSGGGAYARVKAQRIGLAEIIPGVNGGNLFYLFRVDATSFYLKDRNGATIAEIRRSSGTAWFKELRLGSATGPRLLTGIGSPQGVVVGSPGDLYLNTSTAAGYHLWVKESGTGNTGWLGK